MRRSRAPVLSLLPLVSALTIAVALLAPAADAAPTITLSRDHVLLGETTLVTGDGFTPGEELTVELCSNGALDGTADCALESTTTTGVQSTTRFGALLTIARPPGFCPCVVRISGVNLTEPVTVPIVIGEVATDPAGPRTHQPTTDIQHLLKVDSATVDGTTSVAAWFGARPNRTLEVTITNRSAIPVDDPPLTVRVGRGPNPSGIVDPVSIGQIAPGQTKRVSVPFTLPALAFGSYEVSGEITGLGPPIRFTTETSSYPWGLIVAALAVVALIGFRVYRRIRNRRARRSTTSPASGDVGSRAPISWGADITADHSGDHSADELLPASEQPANNGSH